MKKKAIILDLDNTIYPVSSIGQKLFQSLFSLVTKSGEYKGNIEEVKREIMRRPFQFVADDFSFSAELKSSCMKLLSDAAYEDPIQTFEGYTDLQKFQGKKYLVTTGFIKLQHSKIKQLGIEKDFDTIYVIDPSNSALTKKDIFKKILSEKGYKPEDVLVVGDDVNSEIKAARELGIEAVLFNYNGEEVHVTNLTTINHLSDVRHYL